MPSPVAWSKRTATRDRGLQYGGKTFAAASIFARNHSRSVDRDELGREALDSSGDALPPLGGALAFVKLLARLPRVEVRLSDRSSGREIDSYLRARARGVYPNRIAQGVLHLPERPEDYLRGRSRQALRTNLHRAEAAGLRCRPLPDLDERLDTASELGMEEWTAKLEQRPGDPVWVARNEAGENVGLLWATVDDEWAMLRLLVARCSEARYALHTELVSHLCASGVRYLFVRKGCALLLPPGLQYLQQLLGYRVAHLRVRRKAVGTESAQSRQASTQPEMTSSRVPFVPGGAHEAGRERSRA